MKSLLLIFSVIFSFSAFSQNITQVTLINADLDVPIMNVTQGQQIDISTLPTTNLAILVTVNGTIIKKMQFDLTGPVYRSRLDTWTPFTCFAFDTASGNYTGRIFKVGNYSLTVKGINKLGAIVETLTRTFSIIPAPIKYPPTVSLSNAAPLMTAI